MSPVKSLSNGPQQQIFDVKGFYIHQSLLNHTGTHAATHSHTGWGTKGKSKQY